MEPRISVITLGVDDLERAAAFYEALGLERHSKFTDGVAFFQMGGLILALWPREELARDVGKEYRPRTAQAAEMVRTGEHGFTGEVAADFSGVALAYNTRAPEEVSEILAAAEKAGGRLLKGAQQAFWGGVQGYFEDTEGNLWEVAWNPDFPIDAQGRISLPT
ncbi:VOC family protein [Mesorhizobium sp. CAU 1741]|uniref:VOC family protein n=1 Tax=Mesorhizobium sp. CAU 1741 TaxID=3140366 RepID=UPI00325B997A